MTAAAVATGAASLRAAALAHPACPPALRRVAVRDKVRTARDAALSVPGWAGRAGVRSVPSRAHMAQVAADPSNYDSLPDKITALVSYLGCPPAMQWRLPFYYSMENPACPPDVLAYLSLSVKDKFDLESRARHTNCPPNALQRLADDENLAVSRAAANNPACPPAASSWNRSGHSGDPD